MATAGGGGGGGKPSAAKEPSLWSQMAAGYNAVSEVAARAKQEAHALNEKHKLSERATAAQASVAASAAAALERHRQPQPQPQPGAAAVHSHGGLLQARARAGMQVPSQVLPAVPPVPAVPVPAAPVAAPAPAPAMESIFNAGSIRAGLGRAFVSLGERLSTEPAAGQQQQGQAPGAGEPVITVMAEPVTAEPHPPLGVGSVVALPVGPDGLGLEIGAPPPRPGQLGDTGAHDTRCRRAQTTTGR